MGARLQVVGLLTASGMRWGARPHARRLPRALAKPARATLQVGGMVLLVGCADYALSLGEYAYLESLMPGLADLTRRVRVVVVGSDGRLYARTVATDLAPTEPRVCAQDVRAMVAGIQVVQSGLGDAVNHPLAITEAKSLAADLCSALPHRLARGVTVVLCLAPDSECARTMVLVMHPHAGKALPLGAAVAELLGSVHVPVGTGLTQFRGAYRGVPVSAAVCMGDWRSDRRCGLGQ